MLISDFEFDALEHICNCASMVIDCILNAPNPIPYESYSTSPTLWTISETRFDRTVLRELKKMDVADPEAELDEIKKHLAAARIIKMTRPNTYNSKVVLTMEDPDTGKLYRVHRRRIILDITRYWMLTKVYAEEEDCELAPHFTLDQKQYIFLAPAEPIPECVNDHGKPGPIVFYRGNTRLGTDTDLNIKRDHCISYTRPSHK